MDGMAPAASSVSAAGLSGLPNNQKETPITATSMTAAPPSNFGFLKREPEPPDAAASLAGGALSFSRVNDFDTDDTMPVIVSVKLVSSPKASARPSSIGESASSRLATIFAGCSTFFRAGF